MLPRNSTSQILSAFASLNIFPPNGDQNSDGIEFSYPNYWQACALRQLKGHGLTSEMLLNRNDGGHEFNERHYFALLNLVKLSMFNIHDALREIEGLSPAQAGGIEAGLTREDVIQLKNFWHIDALRELKLCGLTSRILLSRNDGGHEFDINHSFALCRLVEDKGFNIHAALKEIEGLSSIQARGIDDGLARQDVLLLENIWHINALEKLKRRGLTSEMLLIRNEGGHKFDQEHYYALINLVEEKKFNIQDALKEIEGVSSDQAKMIRNGQSLIAKMDDYSPNRSLRF